MWAVAWLSTTKAEAHCSLPVNKQFCNLMHLICVLVLLLCVMLCLFGNNEGGDFSVDCLHVSLTRFWSQPRVPIQGFAVSSNSALASFFSPGDFHLFLGHILLLWLVWGQKLHSQELQLAPIDSTLQKKKTKQISIRPTYDFKLVCRARPLQYTLRTYITETTSKNCRWTFNIQDFR